MTTPASPTDHPWEFLAAVYRLAELLVNPHAGAQERGDAVRALTELAHVQPVDVSVRTLAARAGEAPTPGAAEVVAGLHYAAVRRLVVRRGATGRELAQFAGLLARLRVEAGADAQPDPERRAAARSALMRGLDDLGLWNVHLGTLEAPAPARMQERLPELLPAVRAAAGATTPDAVTTAYAALQDVLARVNGQFGDPLRDAAAVTAALAQVARRNERWSADLRRAHHAALVALVERWTDTVARAAIEGALAEAAPVLQVVCDQAVPVLVERLGAAESLDERRRCFGALLDAAGGVGPLLTALHDPRWFVVRNVALALGELRDPSAVRPLARCLAAAGDDRVRVAAAEALERVDTAAATHALLPALRDASSAVRLVAARAAGRARTPELPLRVDLLAARLRVEPDSTVAAELLDGLTAMAAAGDAEATAAVVRVAAGREPTPLGDRLASTALARFLSQPPAQVVAVLRPMAARDPDPALRLAARMVLTRLAQARRGAAAPAHAPDAEPDLVPAAA